MTDIHFIDLCGQVPDDKGRFAFYNSHICTFESHSGVETFDTWEEFCKRFRNDVGYIESGIEESVGLAEYESVVPDWCKGENEVCDVLIGNVRLGCGSALALATLIQSKLGVR